MHVSYAMMIKICMMRMHVMRWNGWRLVEDRRELPPDLTLIQECTRGSTSILAKVNMQKKLTITNLSIRLLHAFKYVFVCGIRVPAVLPDFFVILKTVSEPLGPVVARIPKWFMNTLKGISTGHEDLVGSN